jgi:hypothetical protein
MVNVNLTRIVDALCALWATVASDLIGRALSRAAGFAAGAFKGMRAVTGAGAASAQCVRHRADTPAALSDVLF